MCVVCCSLVYVLVYVASCWCVSLLLFVLWFPLSAACAAVRCWLFVVRWLVRVVRCALLGVCCLLFAVCCALCVACCVLRVVRR